MQPIFIDFELDLELVSDFRIISASMIKELITNIDWINFGTDISLTVKQA